MIRCPTLRPTPARRRARLRDARGAAARPPSSPTTRRRSSCRRPNLPVFRVRRTLGQGGFGAVFLAERISDGQPVAIKVARADNAAAGESLMREAEALSAVGVPHVPAVYERGVLDDGSVYVVMEFVQAPLLADRLTALAGPMPLDEFARDALAILTAVETAHGRGLRPLRSQAGERVRRRDRASSCSTSASCAASARRATASSRPRKRRRPARPSTCRPSSARGAPTSTRAATSTRWA